MRMSPLRLRAKHYSTGARLDILCVDGRIAALDAATDGPADVEAGWVAPALFDLQINGCDGISFNSPRLTAAEIHHVVRTCRRHGIGAFCPTLVTNSREALLHGFTTIRRACEANAD